MQRDSRQNPLHIKYREAFLHFRRIVFRHESERSREIGTFDSQILVAKRECPIHLDDALCERVSQIQKIRDSEKLQNPFNSIIVKWKDYNTGWSNLRVWATGNSYKKYDILYNDINTNKLNNFYYCSGDHYSSNSNSPTGASSAWSQDFFFSPDIGFQNDVKIQVSKVDFKNSFPLRIKTKNNTAKFDINYKFSNISNKQLLCMLHFLENKAGYRKFRHQIPAVYNRPKVYYCPQWTHTWKYKDHNDLDVTFIEDPLGIIPTDT